MSGGRFLLGIENIFCEKCELWINIEMLAGKFFEIFPYKTEQSKKKITWTYESFGIIF